MNDDRILRNEMSLLVCVCVCVCVRSVSAERTQSTVFDVDLTVPAVSTVLRAVCEIPGFDWEKSHYCVSFQKILASIKRTRPQSNRSSRMVV